MRITRTEDRTTGEYRFWLDEGGVLWGPSYDTRKEAEAALAEDTRTRARRQHESSAPWPFDALIDLRADEEAR